VALVFAARIIPQFSQIVSTGLTGALQVGQIVKVPGVVGRAATEGAGT
jgi:hypothetical protein